MFCPNLYLPFDYSIRSSGNRILKIGYDFCGLISSDIHVEPQSRRGTAHSRGARTCAHTHLEDYSSRRPARRLRKVKRALAYAAAGICEWDKDSGAGGSERGT